MSEEGSLYKRQMPKLTFKVGLALFLIIIFGSATGRMVAEVWKGAYCELINE